MRIQCQSCHESMQVPPSAAQRRLKCPCCGARLVIPQSSNEAAEEGAAPAGEEQQPSKSSPRRQTSADPTDQANKKKASKQKRARENKVRAKRPGEKQPKSARKTKRDLSKQSKASEGHANEGQASEGQASEGQANNNQTSADQKLQEKAGKEQATPVGRELSADEQARRKQKQRKRAQREKAKREQARREKAKREQAKRKKGNRDRSSRSLPEPTHAPAKAESPAKANRSRAPRWWMRTPDGAEYGPASANELDEWVVEGRVDASCQIRSDELDWIAADVRYPELAAPSNDLPSNDGPSTDVPSKDVPSTDVPSTDLQSNDSQSNDALASDSPEYYQPPADQLVDVVPSTPNGAATASQVAPHSAAVQAKVDEQQHQQPAAEVAASDSDVVGLDLDDYHYQDSHVVVAEGTQNDFVTPESEAPPATGPLPSVAPNADNIASRAGTVSNAGMAAKAASESNTPQGQMDWQPVVRRLAGMRGVTLTLIALLLAIAALNSVAPIRELMNSTGAEDADNRANVMRIVRLLISLAIAAPAWPAWALAQSLRRWEGAQSQATLAVVAGRIQATGRWMAAGLLLYVVWQLLELFLR